MKAKEFASVIVAGIATAAIIALLFLKPFAIVWRAMYFAQTGVWPEIF